MIFGAALALTLGACTSTADGEAEDQNLEDYSSIIGGTAIGPNVLPAIGIVGILDGSRTGVVGYCSGTLIAPDRVVTAAHCVTAADADGRPAPRPDAPEAFKFITQNTNANRLWIQSSAPLPLAGPGAMDGTIHHVAQVIAPNNINWGAIAGEQFQPFDTSDLVVLRLSKPVTGIAPMPVATNGELNADALNRQVLLVGYGTAGGRDDDLVKRRVTQTITSIGNRYFFLGGAIATRSTCFGDSGGPVLLSIGGRYTVIGVTSGGSLSCLSNQFYTRTDVLRGLRNFTPGYTSGCGAFETPVCMGNSVFVGCSDDAIDRYSCADTGDLCEASPDGATCVPSGEASARQILINGFERANALEINNRLGRQVASNVGTRIVPRPDGRGRALELKPSGPNASWRTEIVAQYVCNDVTNPFSELSLWVAPPRTRASIGVRLVGRIKGEAEQTCLNSDATVRTKVVRQWFGCRARQLRFALSDFAPPAGFVPMAVELVDLSSYENMPFLIDNISLNKP